MEKKADSKTNQNKTNQNDEIFLKSIINTAKKTICDNMMISKGDKVLVALSGGADSVCMLSLLIKLRDEFSITVGAAHLNHMIRGAEADGDEAYCAELCTAFNIPFYATRKDIPTISKERGVSEELAGRNARYDFFGEICQKYGYTKIATAHNKNDRAETLIMRIIRGTGIDGLAGIKYKRDNIIRPILDICREDIEKYCLVTNLRFCTDSTNSSSDYTRNRIRNEVLPMLAEKFNPSVVNTLCMLSDNATEDAEFINGYAKRLYNRINSPMPKRRPIVLDIKSLKMIEKGIRNRIILFAAKDAMSEDYSLSRMHIEAVNSILDHETGASVSLPENLKVSVKYGWLEFTSPKDEEKIKEAGKFLYDLDIDNVKNIDINEITTSAFDMMDSGYNIPDMDYKISICVTDPTIKIKNNQMLLDYDMIEGKMLSVRNRRIGDKIVLFKDGKSKKLKSYFIDKKIPREQRDKIPLLCVADKANNKTEIAAIIGDRVAESYKIKKYTKKGLLITYGTDNENR